MEHITDVAREAMADHPNTPDLDFSDTQTAFAHLSDAELKQMAWLFRMMNKPWLVRLGGPLGLFSVKWNLPFARMITRRTIFRQFVGGRNLLECRGNIDQLAAHGVFSILDYGVEGKEDEEEFNKTMNENIRALHFASRHDHISLISIKVTGLAGFALLEKLHRGDALSEAEQQEYENVRKRLDSICHQANELDVPVMVDAEETWIQDGIDRLVDLMMARYNQKKAVVYNTFQMYRKDRLQFLVDSHQKAKEGSYLLGAKLVRGAYMIKERDRAEEMGYDSPIHESKEATDDAYDTGLRFCLDNHQDIAFCNATHNVNSNRLMAELIAQKELPKDHPHLLFCQLFGMSDNLTFNLAKEGFRVAKYVPYGEVADVIPYLIRRAQENMAVTGDMSREYKLVQEEVERRGL